MWERTRYGLSCYAARVCVSECVRVFEWLQVCVCVCVWEREREREREVFQNYGTYVFLHLLFFLHSCFSSWQRKKNKFLTFVWFIFKSFFIGTNNICVKSNCSKCCPKFCQKFCQNNCRLIILLNSFLELFSCLHQIAKLT